MIHTVVLEAPGTDAVEIRRDQVYRDALTLDVYLPAGAPAGVVVVVSGYADRVVEPVLGTKPKLAPAGASWARLLAASGLAAIRYETEEPVTDLEAVIAHVREHGAALGVAGNRIGLFASSGNVPNGLAAATTAAVRCAVFAYGYLLGPEIAEQAARFGFVAPETAIDELPELPLLVLRAGDDRIDGVNASIDRFVAAALARDLPLELHNLAGAPHAFDLVEPSDRSRDAIRRIIAFLRQHLG